MALGRVTCSDGCSVSMRVTGAVRVRVDGTLLARGIVRAK